MFAFSMLIVSVIALVVSIKRK
ncbi:putative holin-like toxin [Yanshouia hominis]